MNCGEKNVNKLEKETAGVIAEKQYGAGRYKQQKRNQIMLSLTSQAVDQRGPLFFLLFLGCSAVFSIHFTDGGCALSLDLGVKLLVKKDLVNQVRLHGAWLCRGFRGPVVVAWMMKRILGLQCAFKTKSLSINTVS